MAQEFARHLVERGRPGRIVNIASVLGSRTIARVPTYCAAKAGLIHLTHVLAMELARYGILVNALAPGYVETDFNRDFLRSEAGQKARSAHPAAPVRPGRTISTARCCCWRRRPAPISPARSSRSMAATASPRSEPAAGADSRCAALARFLAAASGARACEITDIGAAFRRVDSGELGARRPV